MHSECPSCLKLVHIRASTQKKGYYATKKTEIAKHLLQGQSFGQIAALTFIDFHGDVTFIWAPDVAPGVPRLRQFVAVEYFLIGEAPEPPLIVVTPHVGVVQHAQEVERRPFFPTTVTLNLFHTEIEFNLYDLNVLWRKIIAM